MFCANCKMSICHYQTQQSITPPSLCNNNLPLSITMSPHPPTPSPFHFVAAAAAASAALFCCMAWCSANLNPTLCVILIYLLAQFSKQVVSYLSSDLERKEEIHVPKQRSTSVLYILWFLLCWVSEWVSDVCVCFILIDCSNAHMMCTQERCND